MSSTSPKTYDYSLTSMGCEQHLPKWNYFRFFVRHIYCGVTATPGDVNIIAIKKVNHENISIAVGILFLCALKRSNSQLT